MRNWCIASTTSNDIRGSAMTLRDFTLANLQTAVNRLLELDSNALARLARMHGRVIALDLHGLGLCLYFIPGHDGRLHLYTRHEGPADAVLAGSPFDLLRARDPSAASAQLFDGHVQISGDTELAHRFSAILAGLDIDWEEQLAGLFGDPLAHELGRSTRAAFAELRRVGSILHTDLGEYLVEELQAMPQPYAVEEFLAAVDALRDDVARLDARIALLEGRNTRHSQ